MSQYIILSIMLHLNKTLVRFGKVKSPLCFFCKSSEETTVHLLHRCSFSGNIWSQIQVFVSNYFSIPNISPQSAMLGFMVEIQDQHSIIINHILQIFK